MECKNGEVRRGELSQHVVVIIEYLYVRSKMQAITVVHLSALSHSHSFFSWIFIDRILLHVVVMAHW